METGGSPSETLKSLSNWNSDLDSTLRTLWEQETSFHSMNVLTRFSLRCAISVIEVLDADLNALGLDDERTEDITNCAEAMDDVIPFNHAERTDLADGFVAAADVNEWRQRASDREVLLLERWRQWLDDGLSEGTVNDPASPQQRFLQTVRTLNTVLANVVSPDSPTDATSA